MIVLSPHLDDAVFSCSQILKGARVVTICAGIPPADCPPTIFDERGGFATARDAMEARRAEDRAAAEQLGFDAIHLDLLDCNYGESDLFQGVEKALDLAESGESVYGPLGLRHPDHQVIGSAFRSLARTRDVDAWVYEELPYAYAWPEYLGPALTVAHLTGPTVTRISRESKRDAVQTYASQVSPETHMDAILAPERYHRV